MQQPKFVIVLVLAAILVSSVNCDESSGKEEGGGLWARLKSMVREFVDSMKSIWNEMQQEIRMRTTDMSSWSREMFDSFKTKMKEWLDEVGSAASQKEKEDMRNYIERLEMSTETSNRES